MEEKKLTIERAKQEAKRRARAGHVSHTQALEQIAVEQGFPNWIAMRDDRIANPLPKRQPDFIVELTPIGKKAGEPTQVRVVMFYLLDFSGIDQAEWDQSRADEQEQLVIDYALGTRHQKGDFERYYAEVIFGLDSNDDTPPERMR